MKYNSYTVTYKAVVDIDVSVEVDPASPDQEQAAISTAEDVLGDGDLPAFLAKGSVLERSWRVSVGDQFDFVANEPTVTPEGTVDDDD